MNDDETRALVRKLIAAIGDDPDRPELLETPDRVLRALPELFAYGEDPAQHLEKLFPSPPGVVLTREIPFTSWCEHHLLPFSGTVWISYETTDRVVGLSKLSRCVRGFAQRLQVQERLTHQIGAAIAARLPCAGFAVLVHGVHDCMRLRGVRAAEPATETTCEGGARGPELLARLQERATRRR